MDMQSLRDALRVEIRDLELENARIEERLAEKQRMLSRLDESPVKAGQISHEESPANQWRRLHEASGEEQPLSKPEDFQAVNLTVTPLPSKPGVPARKTITQLGPHHYEMGGSTFKKSGQVLDHLGVPHYFSKKNPGKDAAPREIIRWAKQNPGLAKAVIVVLANGNQMDLHMAISNI